MVGWHHRLNGHEFEQAPGVGDGQGGLACCHSWGHKESDTTEQLNCLKYSWLFNLHFLRLKDIFFLFSLKLIIIYNNLVHSLVTQTVKSLLAKQKTQV